ncbi:hypothetical protein CU044_4029 [Streptomyces sp. L-9-10]|nr:hypothetical protein CU044_4029 [Streptomyces sp. L-9-10]
MSPRIRRQRRVQCPQPLVHGQRLDAHAPDPGQLGPAEMRGQPRAGLLPQSPGQTPGGQSRVHTPYGEGVEERVARGVRALTGTSEHSGERREHDELGQRVLSGQFVQMQRGVQLRSEYAFQPLRVLVEQQSVVQHAGQVPHRVQIIDGTDQTGKGFPVGDVTGHDPYVVGPGRREFGGEVSGPRGPVTLTRGQHQTPDPTGAHQMPGELPAQLTRSSGEQCRSLRRRSTGGDTFRLRFDLDQPRDPDLSSPYRDLGLVRDGHGPGERGDVLGSGTGVHQSQRSLRVLGARGTDQTPQRGVHQAVDALPRLGRYGLPGHPDQFGPVQPGLGQQTLRHVQSRGGGRAHHVRQITRVPRGAVDDEASRGLVAGVEPGAQLVHVDDGPSAGHGREVTGAAEDPGLGRYLASRAGRLEVEPVEVAVRALPQLLFGRRTQHERIHVGHRIAVGVRHPQPGLE